MIKNCLSTEKIENPILVDDPLFTKIHQIVEENLSTITKLNSSQLSTSEIQQAFSDLIDEKVDESFSLRLPFYTDFGRHISIGRHVFINTGVMMTDLGGIVLEDHVLIGPKAMILTVNHPLDPEIRRGLILKPVTIKKNVWIGAGATICPGVTIGENSVVAANATVTKDVPANVVVAGIPAKIIKTIEEVV